MERRHQALVIQTPVAAMRIIQAEKLLQHQREKQSRGLTLAKLANRGIQEQSAVEAVKRAQRYLDKVPAVSSARHLLLQMVG